MRRIGIFVVSFVAVFSVISTVNAGGMFWPGVGAKGLAQADAFVLGTNDSASLWYNPAQMFNSRGIAIQLDGTASHLSLEYSRSSDFVHTVPIDNLGRCVFGDPDEDGNCPIPDTLPAEKMTKYRKVSNSSSGFAMPVMGVVWDVNGVLDDSLRLGMSWYGMNHPSFGFQKDSPPRYSAYEQAFQDQTIAMGAGYSLFSGRLRFGAALQMHILWFRRAWMTNFTDLKTQCQKWIKDTGSSDACSSNYIYYDQTFDARSIFEGYDFALSGNIGISGNVWSGLWLGASVQTPYSFDSTGDLWVEVPVGISGKTKASWKGSEADISFNLPLILRAGFGWLEDRFGVELNYTLEMWSMQDRFVIKPKKGYTLTIERTDENGDPVIETVDMIATEDPMDPNGQLMSDTHRIALGGYFDVLNDKSFIPRAGLFFETGALSGSRLTSTRYYDPSKFGMGIGLTFNESWLEVTGSFNYVWYFSETVEDGAVIIPHAQIGVSGYAADPNKPASEQNPPLSANSGTYQGEAWFFSLGIGVHLD